MPFDISPQPHLAPPRIAAVIVTRDRPELLARCLDAIERQTIAPVCTVVVDNAGTAPAEIVTQHRRSVALITLRSNRGAAAGFGIGIRAALARGATPVWLMDDDAAADTHDCLALLLRAIEQDGNDIAAPLVRSDRHPERLGFPLRIRGRTRFLAEDLDGAEHIDGFAHSFNGVLIRATVFERIGMPMPALVMRGDEVEFRLRARRAGLRIVTKTQASLLHPDSMGEIHPILFGLFYAVMPSDRTKAYFQFRKPRLDFCALRAMGLACRRPCPLRLPLRPDARCGRMVALADHHLERRSGPSRTAGPIRTDARLRPPGAGAAMSLVLQRIVAPRTTETAALFWRHDPPAPVLRMARSIPRGGALDLDTYFNVFDERGWRRHTQLGDLALQIELDGACKIEIWRYSRHAPPALIAEAAARSGTNRLEVPAPPHDCAAGRLALRLVVSGRAAGPAWLLGGAWITDAHPAPVRVMPVICTFDRELPLARMLSAIGEDSEALAAIAALIVVNHGDPALASRLDIPAALRRKLRLVHQRNVGGAGGFTRGLLEAKAAGATHAILMDDDVTLEPDTLLRASRFFALEREETVIAGHMLDGFRPTHLYEAGARLDDSKLAIVPLHLGAELSHPSALDRFIDEKPMHYNGWWFFGLKLTLLDRHGWPMPCFLRGDDVEFGRRLHDSGTPLISLLGIGIWHEPFYAKLGSWHVYYEFRNMAVLAAWHLPGAARRIATVMLKWTVAELLMFRYQRAALILRACHDFLRGPEVFALPPATLHAELLSLRARYPVETVRRECVLHQREPQRGPRSRLAFVAGVLGALWSEWWRPDRNAVTLAVEPRDHVWFRIRGTDAVVVREAWETAWPAFHRDRATYRALLRETLQLAWRLRKLRHAVAAWREARAGLLTESAWRNYLERHAGMPAHAIGAQEIDLPEAA